MEHRWSERKTTKLDAMLDYPPLGFVRASVRDVCVGGAFVETNAATLQMNTPVDLMLRLPSRGASVFRRLPALVVWVGPGRAGLMFRSFSQQTYEALRALLHEDVSALGALTKPGLPADPPNEGWRPFAPRAMAR